LQYQYIVPALVETPYAQPYISTYGCGLVEPNIWVSKHEEKGCEMKENMRKRWFCGMEEITWEICKL